MSVMLGSIKGVRAERACALAIALFFSAVSSRSFAQTLPTPGPSQRESSGDAFDRTPENEPSAPPSARPRYQLTRWLEDWRALADPAKRVDPFDPVKYVALDGSGLAHLTLSGQWREDLYANDGGVFSPSGDTYGLHRIYLGADLHVGQARIFAEVADTIAIGKTRPLAPTDEDRLDLQLLFADYRIDVGGDAQVIARVGRQEFAFDPTQRFVGTREGPNNRQAFDAVRVNLKAKGLYVSAFASRPVTYRPGVFDDPRNRDVAFRGIYVTRAAAGQTQSVYVYGYDNDAARFGVVTGRERRTAIGARIAGRTGPFDYDVEGMRQTGAFAGSRISAWGVGSVAGVTLKDLPFAPRIGVQADFASGDGDPSDDRVGTFNPLFFKGGYFLEAPISSFANIRHLKGSLSVRPGKSGSLSLAYGDFAKLRLADALYANPLIAFAATRAMTGRRVGGYLQAVGSRQFGPHFSLSFEADRFRRSRALADVGGRNVDLLRLTANFLF